MNQINYIILRFFILITVFVALITFFLCIYKLFKVNIEIKKVKKQLENIDVSIKTKEKLKQINEIFKQNTKDLVKDWEIYLTIVRKQDELDNILNPNYIFNFERLVQKYSNRKLANAAPSILTGIGILGTFTGLVIGIWNLDKFEIVQLKDNLPILISGMKISFVSSLVAISLSLLWSFNDKMVIFKFERYIEDLEEKFYKILPVRVESNQLDTIVRNQERQIQATNEFISDTLIPELVNGLKEAVDKTIAPEINRMNDTVDKLANISTSKQAESLDKMVDKFMGTFNEAFDYQFDSLKETLKDVILWQKETKKEMDELIKTIEINARNQSELMNSTEYLLKDLQDYVEQFKGFHQELRVNLTSLNQTTEKLNEVELRVNDRLSLISKEYKQLQEAKDEEINRLEKAIEEINYFWNNIKENFAGLNNNLSSAMEQFAENTYRGLERTFENFDQNLAEITRRLGATIAEINDTVEDLPDSLDRLVVILKEFETEHKTVLKQLETINTKMDNIGERKGLLSRLGGQPK